MVQRSPGSGAENARPGGAQARLAARLDTLRAASGLSLRELQRHTHSSDSSLSRYFSGQTRPPWSVVVALCGLSDQDPADLRPLWQAAQSRIPMTESGSGGGALDTAGAQAAVPRQLPAAPRYFVGRDAPAAVMTGALRTQSKSGPLLAVVGPGGIGKTTLALAWAHRVAPGYPDGQLYVNLRGFDPGGTPVAADDAVTGFLQALGVPAQRMPTSPADRLAAFRTRTADRRLLVLLDNAVDSDHVRDLLPSGRDCLTVVTSRNRLVGLVAVEGAHPVRLDPLGDAEALRLLAARLGPERVAQDRESLSVLAAACAGLPLALAILAARLVLEPDLDVRALAALVRDERRALSELNAAEASVDLRSVFSWSYRRLSPAAAALFVRLGLHPGPTVAPRAAVTLAPAGDAEASAALRELVAAHLLAADADGRLRMHDLIRLYAAELADATLGEAEAHSVRTAMFDYYLHSAVAASLIHAPRVLSVPLPDPRPEVKAERFDDRAEATAWLEAEREVLIALAFSAARSGFDEHVWQFNWALAVLLGRRGEWRTTAALDRLSIAAADRLGDPARRAHARSDAAATLDRLGETEAALAHITEALPLYEEVGDHIGQAVAEMRLALIHERTSYPKALEHAARAVDQAHRGGDAAIEAGALVSLAWAHACCGNHEEALEIGARAVPMNRRVGQLVGAAHALDTMGLACHRLGRLAEALEHYEAAAAVFQEAGDRYSLASTLARTAAVHTARGDGESARRLHAAVSAEVAELEVADHDALHELLAEALAGSPVEG